MNKQIGLFAVRPQIHLMGIELEDRPKMFHGRLRVGPTKGEWFAGDLDTNHHGTISVTGTSALPMDGQLIVATGKWTNHHTFGEQFRIDRIRVEDTANAEKLFLMSGAIVGMKKVLARRFMTLYKDVDNLFDHLNEEDLTAVKGIGPKSVKPMLSCWDRIKPSAKAHAWGLTIGLSLRESKEAYEMWGDEMRSVLEDKPYALLQIHTMSFPRVDDLALNQMGLPKDNPDRYEAATLWVLRQATRAGHCGLPTYTSREHPYMNTAWTEFRELVGNASNELWRDTVVGREDSEDRMVEVIRQDGDVVFLADRQLYGREKDVARDVRRLVAAQHEPLVDPETEDIDALIDVLSDPLTLAPQQRAAVKMAATEPIMVLTGGPGTGKTTVTRVILDLFEKYCGLSVLCASPTGKAAMRMEEATGRPAMTIHRALEWKGHFLLNKDSPIPNDVVVLDEVSMMDIDLAWSVLQAVDAQKTRLILVGDADQLPAVGPGQVFRDLIESGAVPTVKLTEIHRQAKGSGIIHNARALNNGGDWRLEGFDDFVWAHTSKSIPDAAVNWLCDRVDHTEAVVLAPYNVHVNHINLECQNRLNKNERHRVSKWLQLSIGDPVIHIRNNYNLGVFNGETGRIMHIMDEDELRDWRTNHSMFENKPPEIFVDYNGRPVFYTKAEAGAELRLAYALTIHKSQGSEWPIVILALPPVNRAFFTRELPYTGMTRAKEGLVVIGDPGYSLPMLKEAESRAFRWTRLKTLLEDSA